MTAPTWTFISWRTTPLSPMTACFPSRIRLLVLLVAFLALSSLTQATSAASFHNLYKRGGFTPSSYCGEQGKVNGDIVCAPIGGEKYRYPGYITAAWNSADGVVGAINAVDIYLERQDTAVPIGSWLGIPNADTTHDIQISEKWFPQRINKSEPQEVQFKILILPAKANLATDAKPGNIGGLFTITRPPDLNSSSPTSASTSVQTVTASSAQETVYKDKKGNSKGLSAPLVAVISVTGVAVLAAIVAIFCLFKSRKRSVRHHSLDPGSPIDVASIHSTTPLATKDSIPNISQLASIAPSSSSRSNLSSVPVVTFAPANQNAALSVSDASILSDAFRNALRKPDWANENTNADDDDDDVEEEEDESALTEEERQRRKDAKKLMKMELAEEGTGLRTVQRRATRAQIRKTNEGSNDSIEAGSATPSPTTSSPTTPSSTIAGSGSLL